MASRLPCLTRPFPMPRDNLLPSSTSAPAWAAAPSGRRRVRDVTAPLTAVLLLVLSVAAPVLEAHDLLHGVAVESGHGSHCPAPHQHWIHAQLGSTPALPSTSSLEATRAHVCAAGCDVTPPSATQRPEGRLPEARAPPAS